MNAWAPGATDERALRDEMVRVARRTYEAGLVAATDGNLSHRLGTDRLLITRSGVCLGELTTDDIVRVTLSGEPLPGEAHRPSSEYRMHVVVYEARADVHAVLHAHPPITLGFSIAGESLAGCVLPEVVVGLGTIPTLDYTTPTTEATAALVGEMIPSRDALILDRHGTVTVADTITHAFHKLDKVEHTAKITLHAKQLGKVRTLPPQEVQKLLGMREKMGLPPLIPNCNNCGICITK
ncbi:MAG: class II aldolase/adducin family protein [Planctomycetota bacterium]